MSQTLWLVACGFGLAVLAALAIVYRRAAARREMELVDELLDEELRRLEPPEKRVSR